MTASSPRRAVEPIQPSPSRTQSTRRRLMLALLAPAMSVGLLAGAPAAPAAATPVSSPAAAPAPAAAATSIGMFSASSKPKIKAVKTKQAVNLGIRFSPTTDGVITALQFYRSSKQKKAYVGSLWSSKGKLLGRVTFPKSSKVGWQTASLKKSVAVKARATYTASYLASDGRFAVTRGSLSKSGVRGLFRLAKHAGQYKYTKKSVRPTKVSGSNYFVDVVFKKEANTANKPTPAPTPPTTTPPSVSSPAAKAFPTRETTGVPSGWTPKTKITGDYVVDQEGAVVEDLRVTDGILYVRANNVTLRRVELVSARIVNYWGRCFNGLRIEDTSILRGARDTGKPVVTFGGYTAVRVKIDGTTEGFRVGEEARGCGSVVIQDSFVSVEPPANCVANGPSSWHGDAIQGYQGAALTVRNSYLRVGSIKGCLGTAPFFYPDQNNTRATVDHLLVEGGGFSFRLQTEGSVTGLKVVNNSWGYQPVQIGDCDDVAWGAGNEVVSVASDGSLRSVRALACSEQ